MDRTAARTAEIASLAWAFLRTSDDCAGWEVAVGVEHDPVDPDVVGFRMRAGRFTAVRYLSRVLIDRVELPAAVAAQLAQEWLAGLRQQAAPAWHHSSGRAEHGGGHDGTGAAEHRE